MYSLFHSRRKNYFCASILQYFSELIWNTVITNTSNPIKSVIWRTTLIFSPFIVQYYNYLVILYIHCLIQEGKAIFVLQYFSELIWNKVITKMSSTIKSVCFEEPLSYFRHLIFCSTFKKSKSSTTADIFFTQIYSVRYIPFMVYNPLKN